jgi:hypothetical protein
MLGIAVSDCDAGRISRTHLPKISQEAIDNGDVLGKADESIVVAHVIPPAESGLLRTSEHLGRFRRRMDAKSAGWSERWGVCGCSCCCSASVP